MSTTFRAILMMGCRGEFRPVTRLEPRFDPKTGQSTNPAKVVDHIELVVNERVIWSGQEHWQADEALELIHGLRVWAGPDNEIIVGERLGVANNFGSFIEVIPSTDVGKTAKLHGVLGTVPTLFLIQDCF